MRRLSGRGTPFPPSLILALFAFLACGSLPVLADEVPAAAAVRETRYTYLLAGNIAGSVTAKPADASGRNTTYDFEYNDRGRGPKLRTREVLDERGLPVRVEIDGTDYWKNPVVERFEVSTDKASWKSASEAGGRDFDSHSFYVGLNSSPVEVGLLARALLDNRRRRLDLLPDGEARIEKVASAPAHAAGITRSVDLYAISGLALAPTYVWLDGQKNFFAATSGWQTVVLEGWEPALEDLAKVQDGVMVARQKALFKEVVRRPERLLIRNARVFDPETARSRPGMSVLVFRNRIEKVGADREVEIPDGAEIIDAKGKTLLPGLWDMHVHLGPDDGPLDLAAGITTVRDMANDTDQLLAMKRGFDASEAIGPHVLMAGFIDGPGPFAGPSKVLVDTEEKAVAAVDRYAQLGYVQIKLYSSLDPKLVPAIVERAKKHNLRLSGHIPNGLTAEQAVRAGFNEIQHVNFLFLNFLDNVDTRTPARFSAVAEHAAELDLQSDKVRAFLALLKERGTAVDPTLNAFEGMFLTHSGQLDPSLAPIADRLPLQVRRGLFGGGIVTAGKEEAYRKSFQALLAMVRALYDAGIPIEAGTDSLAGFNLHRELELYVQAGIPAPQALRIATLGAAKIMGRDAEMGTIAPGKIADLVLVDGDPTTNISDIRRVVLTVKDGTIYDPVKIDRAIGVKPIE